MIWDESAVVVEDKEPLARTFVEGLEVGHVEALEFIVFPRFFAGLLQGGDHPPSPQGARVRVDITGKLVVPNLLSGAAHGQCHVHTLCHLVCVIRVDNKSALKIRGAAGELRINQDAKGRREGGREGRRVRHAIVCDVRYKRKLIAREGEKKGLTRAGSAAGRQ